MSMLASIVDSILTGRADRKFGIPMLNTGCTVHLSYQAQQWDGQVVAWQPVILEGFHWLQDPSILLETNNWKISLSSTMQSIFSNRMLLLHFNFFKNLLIEILLQSNHHVIQMSVKHVWAPLSIPSSLSYTLTVWLVVSIVVCFMTPFGP